MCKTEGPATEIIPDSATIDITPELHNAASSPHSTAAGQDIMGLLQVCSGSDPHLVFRLCSRSMGPEN